MLDSDWCIVWSRMTVMTLVVKLEWNSISNWFDSPHQEIGLCKVILDIKSNQKLFIHMYKQVHSVYKSNYICYGFRSDGELWS